MSAQCDKDSRINERQLTGSIAALRYARLIDLLNASTPFLVTLIEIHSPRDTLAHFTKGSCVSNSENPHDDIRAKTVAILLLIEK